MPVPRPQLSVSGTPPAQSTSTRGRRANMSVVDKVLAKLTPPESEDKRSEATARARAMAAPGDWLSMALDHHAQIRAAFAAARTAESSAERTMALKALALILNGHSLAEELVLYPALAQIGEKAHAGLAYT